MRMRRLSGLLSGFGEWRTRRKEGRAVAKGIEEASVPPPNLHLFFSSSPSSTRSSSRTWTNHLLPSAVPFPFVLHRLRPRSPYTDGSSTFRLSSSSPSSFPPCFTASSAPTAPPSIFTCGEEEDGDNAVYASALETDSPAPGTVFSLFLQHLNSLPPFPSTSSDDSPVSLTSPSATASTDSVNTVDLVVLPSRFSSSSGLDEDGGSFWCEGAAELEEEYRAGCLGK
ncbi:hypothetical protein JCM8547_005118 [Rhodosporidiobolus lusitaniae]